MMHDAPHVCDIINKCCELAIEKNTHIIKPRLVELRMAAIRQTLSSTGLSFTLMQVAAAVRPALPLDSRNHIRDLLVAVLPRVVLVRH